MGLFFMANFMDVNVPGGSMKENGEKPRHGDLFTRTKWDIIGG